MGGSLPSEAQIASLSPAELEKYEYLRAQVMPTLSGSLRALLREREDRQALPGSEAVPRLVRLNALSYVAQHLMRNNPNPCAPTEA